MKKPNYPEIEYAISAESWEEIFLDEDGNELIYEIPHYIPPRLHWRTYQGDQPHYGWISLDLQMVINDSLDDIINIHKHQIISELKHRIGF